MSDLSERHPLHLHDSLQRRKVRFEPLHPPAVGLYACGPTVYGDPHLGHARGALTWDLFYRYLTRLGYRVRYVRNITDVGHLTDEVGGTGEDKVSRKARVERLEPMEVVQQYTNAYHRAMDRLNCLRPSIEPTASGHITEQIAATRTLIERGYAYESAGSVYFDLDKYAAEQDYGKLSGKVLEDLVSGSRDTEGLDEKRGPHDFALWKKAQPEHLMRWPSPWGEGFPGWHLECSVMSTKYLGETFDIHGGGMDLLFPHHEAERAQNFGCLGHHAVRHWVHHNMITLEGQKMAKSKGNFITLDELFSGEHALLEQAYSPMTIRFFTLQAHYRSPVDFSNAGLQAAAKGYRRLMQAWRALEGLQPAGKKQRDAELEARLAEAGEGVWRELSDDLNTPKALALCFDVASRIQDLAAGRAGIGAEALEALRGWFGAVLFDVFGLVDERADDGEHLRRVVDVLIRLRAEARAAKDWATSDRIRDELAAAGVQLLDGPDGTAFRVTD